MNATIPALPRREHARPGGAAAREPGRGALACALVDGATTVVRSAAQAPLKLLVPRRRGASAWACAASFGGGLLAGDHLRLEVSVGTGATLVVGTQSATKVYRSDDGREARQSLRAEVGDGAALALLPDAVTAFRGARYAQRQEVGLHRGGSLLLLDWMTSGRAARDERWAFAGYASRNRVEVDGQPRWIDAVRLDGGARLAARMGRFHTLATVLLLGPRFAAAAAAVHAEVATLPVTARQALLLSASPIGDAPPLGGGSPIAGGMVLRCAGMEHGAVEHAVRRLLAPALGLVGGDPWNRRG